MVSFMGRLFRFRLDWNDAGVTVTPMGWLAPTLAEADNRHGTAIAQYGGAVSFSRDGGTLAVSASRMNVMGAVYVYSRPDGPGEDWGDLEYADGVKVTVGAVPSWGTSTTNMPFLPGTAYDASNPRSCDAWCSMVWSSTNTQSYDGVELGSMRVSLSADGSVLLVGAAAKEYAVTTPGGGFVAGNRRDNAGEAFVWVAPAGGWKNAPRADRDASGNAKTLIAAKTDATNFRRATHYSPGPLRRVTEPAAILAPGTWPNVGNYYFGNDAVVSPDGATAAVANADGNPARGAVYIFQRDSAGDWASVNGGYLTPDATLSGLSYASEATSGVQFSADGSELAVGQVLLSTSNTAGQIRVFFRPADGTWVSAAASTARLLQEPADVRGHGSGYGNLTPELSGQRVAIGTQRQNREYLASLDGCRVSTVDDATSVRCPITLRDARITIPPGTPDGPFTISGSVAVQLGSGDPITLRDELEVTVGTVDELAKLEFAFATDTLGDSDSSNDRPYPSVVAPGGSTTLQLQLLNENGKASARGAAASVLFSTTRGGLSARLASARGEACAASGGQSCRIANPATALTADNADQIRLTVTHPGVAQAGAARVRAVVVNAAGRTFRTEPITVIFAGPPTTLAIAQPPNALLGYVPAGSVDQRNIATLVVSATDAAGNKATVPDGRRSWKLTSPDRKAIDRRQIEVTWPLRKGGTGDDAGELVRSEGDPQARVTILADAAAPLAEGEYTLELSVGSGAAKLTDTQTFVVTGGAAALTLSADPAGEVAERDTITLTAAVTDANGEPAPDGTPVTFSEGSASGEVVLVLLNPARQLTRGGQAAVELRAVNGGVGYVRAEADAASGVQTISVAAGAGSVENTIAGLTLDAFSIWTSAQPTTAAELHARLANVARISKWHGSGWYSYGRAGGQFVADSVNFPINPGDTLWLDSK